MEEFLPFFPLKLVVFPDEKLNLHVFEPRYKQLISECVAVGKSFGIPVFDTGIMEFGSEMIVEKVVKTYPNGEMDIVARCTRVFELVTFQEMLEGKLYAGGKVTFIENNKDGEAAQWSRLKELAKQLIELLRMDHKLNVADLTEEYQLAHKLGLSLEQEYDMLQMENQSQRYEYLISHMERAIPFVKEMERAKERIQLNGHFQHIDPLKF
ncbi:LON peptidase substrate-binding domain-containing protein [Roseivirga sp.]|uniref:LON peptidase substrate-binding domain-containing protein n=1 Tax=Roseivirga sp. TaxID=1964215 RepID=UPI002B269A11|nr:LON peptidase substrate-binding domain-containing protein [Roseivirga sp.]